MVDGLDLTIALFLIVRRKNPDARTFTHGNVAVSAAKSAGRRTPRKGIVTGGVNFDMRTTMIGGILDGHLLVLSVRTIEPVALSRR